MPEKIAIKVMAGSDLSFFDQLFKQRRTKSNQKAINLNADVFADVLYPNFAEIHPSEGGETRVSVTLRGPLPGRPYRFIRSITKSENSKNWRLNGATVPDPDGEKDKFNDLNAQDIAVIEFHGDPRPEALTLVLVSAKHDARLRERLAAETQGKSMARIARTRLIEIADAVGADSHHPIRALLIDQELESLLEQAKIGAAPAVRKLRARIGRKLSQAELDATLGKIRRIGLDGEAAAYALLMAMKEEGAWAAVTWISKEDAEASWDFEVQETDGRRIRLDAKSTTLPFERYFFLSAAETKAASETAVPYRIIRISDLTDDGAVARISKDINGFAAGIIKWTERLPDGALPTGFSLDTRAIEWESPVPIVRR